MAVNQFETLLFTDVLCITQMESIALNALLVHTGVRPAFLIQSIDYGENQEGMLTRGPITNKILNCLVSYFKIREVSNQGFLILKNEDNFQEEDWKNFSLEQIGKYLGYPYPIDVYKRNFSYYEYMYNIYAQTDVTTVTNVADIVTAKKVYIFGYICHEDMAEETSKRIQEVQQCVNTYLPNLKFEIKCEYEKRPSFGMLIQYVNDIKDGRIINDDDIGKEVYSYLNNTIGPHSLFDGDIDLFKNINALLTLMYFSKNIPYGIGDDYDEFINDVCKLF